MALGFWTTRREMAGIANSLGEIVKVDHHKLDVNFDNLFFGYAVTVEGSFAVLRDYADRHLGSPLRCE